VTQRVEPRETGQERSGCGVSGSFWRRGKVHSDEKREPILRKISDKASGGETSQERGDSLSQGNFRAKKRGGPARLGRYLGGNTCREHVKGKIEEKIKWGRKSPEIGASSPKGPSLKHRAIRRGGGNAHEESIPRATTYCILYGGENTGKKTTGFRPSFFRKKSSGKTSKDRQVGKSLTPYNS